MADARAYILEKLSDSDQERNAWQTATARLIQAAEQNGSVKEATEALRRALFFQARLKLDGAR